MNRISIVLTACFAIGLVGVFASTSEAHMVFKKQIQKKYANTTVTCYACHIKGKHKRERTEFGKLFAKEFKTQKLTLTADWDAAKKVSKEARKKFETATMAPEFVKALKKIKETTNPKKEKYDDLIKTGKIDGIKLKEKK